eukprot:TRINITY_DN8350_c0_g1_i2.p1 TRINITY_DN8350_c0_g1~~TRINITY_DN8350_c0_g1_i2.p1  ORF type:complete len:405 (+),score=74.59 TRINITY_DN8350_c0_g1_i2:30-1217(+)
MDVDTAVVPSRVDIQDSLKHVEHLRTCLQRILQHKQTHTSASTKDEEDFRSTLLTLKSSCDELSSSLQPQYDHLDNHIDRLAEKDGVLASLRYTRDILTKEIQDCRNGGDALQSLQADSSRFQGWQTRDHLSVLRLLEQELDERIKLATTISQQQRAKKTLTEQNTSLAKQLTTLEASLKNFTRAALKEMQPSIAFVPLQSTSAYDKQDRYLPAPLFILYNEGKIVRESSHPNTFLMQILGKTDDDDATTIPSSATSSSSVKSSPNIFAASPLSVAITLASPHTTVTMIFHHYPNLHFVTVQQAAPADPLQALLASLVPEDSGMVSPNPSSQLLGGDTADFNPLSPEHGILGRPYMWAQTLCGITPSNSKAPQRSSLQMIVRLIRTALDMLGPHR